MIFDIMNACRAVNDIKEGHVTVVFYCSGVIIKGLRSDGHVVEEVIGFASLEAMTDPQDYVLRAINSVGKRFDV